jgi:phospholipid/cholesterol/gamma-HCH transport system substrate-binding protein
MRMTRTIWIQITIFVVISLVAFTIMSLGYIKLPDLLFGAGHYRVTIDLPAAGGLYERANVTYRGTEIGKVESVTVTDTGVQAVLSLRSDIEIPSNLQAEVHSQSAVGEQYVALLPKDGKAAALKDGDVIPESETTVPPDINALLDATNTGLKAIPKDNLKTTVDEAYTAFGGLGPDISRLVKGSTKLAIDARHNLDDLTNVVDNVAPILDTQTDTSDSIQAWAAHLANVTRQLQSHDDAVRGILQHGTSSTQEVRALLDRLQPTLPIVLANLVSVGQVAVTYRSSLEQILVLLPQGAADMQAISVANRDTRQAYNGAFLSFNLNLNLPSPCTTGFLPVQQQRSASFTDYPDRPAGDLYCRVPQDSTLNVRAARNTPCTTVPGKRAPTVKMCESQENYVPLNDGFNWKGDPNSTLSGQPIPQLPPGATPTAIPPPAAPPPGAPLAVAEYDPATGTYTGPDGHQYIEANLAPNAHKEQTWQKMLLPPPGS